MRTKEQRTKDWTIMFQKALGKRKKQSSIDHEFKYIILKNIIQISIWK